MEYQSLPGKISQRILASEIEEILLGDTNATVETRFTQHRPGVHQSLLMFGFGECGECRRRSHAGVTGVGPR